MTNLLLILSFVIAAVAGTIIAEPDSSSALARECAPGESMDHWAKSLFNKTAAELFDVAPTDFVYTYHQQSGSFSGTGYDGTPINVVGCSGKAGPCRNNPSCQCKVAVGPLPRATYRIGQEQVFKTMPSCYPLQPIAGDMCGRSGFLIHGGGCQADPSEGCIVISDVGVRHKIKSGGTLNVVV